MIELGWIHLRESQVSDKYSSTYTVIGTVDFAKREMPTRERAEPPCLVPEINRDERNEIGGSHHF
jgi:hypothetical protein